MVAEKFSGKIFLRGLLDNLSSVNRDEDKGEKMMAQDFKVETTTIAVRDRKGVPVTRSLASVTLYQHGVPVANFDDVALAHHCAELLNKNGVS